MASCVATAYIMRYGRLNAGAGPAGGVCTEGSLSRGFGEGPARLGEGDGALVMGGGSIEACEVGGFDGMMGSGKDGISSSIVEVSMVICLVTGTF